MKIFAIISACVLALGTLLFGAGMVATHGNWEEVKDAFTVDDDYQKVVKTGTELPNNVIVDAKDNTVEFLHSSDNTYRIEYYESDDDYYVFASENGVLTLTNFRKFRFSWWGIKSPEVSAVRIYLPNDYSGAINAKVSTGTVNLTDYPKVCELTITASTGEIRISNTAVFGSLKATASTGEITLENITAASLTANASTGEVHINNAVISGITTLGISTGDIKYYNSESASVRCIASTGDIDIGNLKTDAIEARASTGSIAIELIGNEDEYTADLEASLGDIRFQGIDSDHRLYIGNGPKTIKASVSTGDIRITIKE
jgi:hypothetical protein